MSNLINGYTLLDSGEGRKLEQFGSRIIDRPSSLSTWRRRESDTAWDSADAAYTPPDRWEHLGRSFETWEATVEGVKLELELMSNGQLGIFPEHALYLPKVKSIAERLSSKGARPLRVLNLFAYTGLATCYCAALPNVTVTHVDLAKRAIEWAKKNASLNSIPENKIRWILDDALSFMAREHRKGSLYDIVIIDPPSFSRVSKNNSWTLEEKAPEIVELTLNVLDPKAGAVFFTNHSTASTSDVVRNISLDMYNDSGVEISIESLSLQEQKTSRLLPAGSLITLFHSIDSQ
jgi:23S rRNA (cytosine1962-C5)-methyltransferase